ncbi:hypothetical protein [Cryphonectria carpinicola fusagravirus 1]|uniref:Hypothetical protein protein n=1 Tax=Cryphonectria carpinicola fusagravirus 1 TaxID=2879941 RepID=A0A8J9WV69_9VIRU|nr:hypothetical protein [Cryphonectria carpinicola fusagravirus 1]
MASSSSSRSARTLNEQISSLPTRPILQGEVVPSQPNGLCYLNFFHPASHSLFDKTRVWEKPAEIVQHAISVGAVLVADQKFSVQLGGQYLRKLSSSGPSIEYAHVARSGSWTPAQILSAECFAETRFGGESHSTGLAPMILSLLLSFFLFIGTAVGGYLWAWQPAHYSSPPNYGPGSCYLVYFHPLVRPFAFALLGLRPRLWSVRLLALVLPTVSETNLMVQKAFTLADGTAVYHVTACTGGSWAGFGPRMSLASLDPSARLGQFSPSPEDQVIETKDAPVAKAVTGVPSLQSLGGVRQVPTSLPVPQISPGFQRRWSPSTFPASLTSENLVWEHSEDGHLAVKRVSEFVRHFPEDSAISRLPQRFAETLLVKWFARRDCNEASTVPASYRRSFDRDIVQRTVLDEFSSIGQVLDNNLTLDVLKDADSSAAYSRGLGSRNQRLVPGWEAAVMTRWLRFRDFATRSASARSYKEFVFRLASRFTLATAAQDIVNSVPDYATHVADTATDVQIIHLNADPIIPAPVAGQPPPPPVWGEAQLWDPAMIQALVDGRAQLIDAEGFTKEEIAQIIGCLAPSGAGNVPILRRSVVPDPATPDATEDVDMLPACARFTYPNGVTHIIVHHGNSAIPDQADQQWIAAHAFDFPSLAILATVMRTYATRHALEDLFKWAFEAVAYRTAFYTAADALGARHDLHSDLLISAQGASELHLPRNVTGSAYFDTFFAPVQVTGDLEMYLYATPQQLVTSATLASHCRAVALAWACKSGSLLGLSFTRAAARQNQFTRNQQDKWLRMYYGELNIFSALHANAMGFQYGFAPSALVRRTEGGLLPDWWKNYVAPTLVNHYLELWAMQSIPTFQVLPYYDATAKTSHVQWPEDTPDSTAALPSFNTERKVRLAREFSPLTGHSWLGDGGAEYNAQFYYAQGADGRFAYEGAEPKANFSSWTGTFARSFPSTPAAARGISLTNGRLGEAFSDFILPGSFISYRVASDKVINWGVNQIDDRALNNSEVRRWWLASKGAAHTSLMVNYVSPISQHYELDDFADYSVTLWEKEGRFAALSFGPLPRLLAPDTFDPVNITRDQSAFNLRFDSKPYALDQLSTSRITHNARSDVPASGPQTKYTPAEVNARVAAAISSRRNRPSGQVSYQAKNPIFADQLPHLNDYSVDVREEGLDFSRPNENSGALPAQDETSSDRLRQIQEAEARLDNAFQEYMADQQQKRAIRQARVAHVQPTFTPVPIHAPIPQRRRRLPTVTDNGPPVPVSVPVSRHKGHMTYSANRPLQQQAPPVVPNDAAAASVQQMSVNLAELQRRRASLTPTLAGPNGRRAASPRARYLSKRNEAGQPTARFGDVVHMHHIKEQDAPPTVSSPKPGEPLPDLSWAQPQPFLTNQQPPDPAQALPPQPTEEEYPRLANRARPSSAPEQVDFSQIDWDHGSGDARAQMLEEFSRKAHQHVDMTKPKN